METQTRLFNSPASHCSICGRPLSDSVSMARGIGPICLGKHGTRPPENGDPEAFTDFTRFDPIEEGIILARDQRGVWTNIPHLVTHHSPTGYEYGYSGSGPADLALNICEMILNRLGHKGARVNCWRGDCWAAAFDMHQEFKFEFIAPAQGEFNRIPYPQAERWVKYYLEREAGRWEGDDELTARYLRGEIDVLGDRI